MAGIFFASFTAWYALSLLCGRPNVYVPTRGEKNNRDELYQLLDVDRRATPVDIKRAYRNKSLQMHPDKLNQRGQEVTEEDRAKFQRMKSAYDVSL